MSGKQSDDARARAAKVKMLLLDVDGTITDGRLIIGDDGVIARAYNTQDGLGIKRLVAAGCKVGIVTAAGGRGVEERARELGIVRLHQYIRDKKTATRQILADENLRPEQAAFMGDDLNDLEAMQSVGFACAPANAAAEVLESAHFVSERPGGMGAAREVSDFIFRHWTGPDGE